MEEAELAQRKKICLVRASRFLPHSSKAANHTATAFGEQRECRCSYPTGERGRGTRFLLGNGLDNAVLFT